MVKSYRSKKHNKKHRGGEGEVAEDNSVLNMDDKAPASAPAPTPASSSEPESAPAPATPAPVEEEKKSWFKSLFGGSKKKHVRFRTTKKHKRSGHKKSGHKRTKRKSRRSMRSGSKRKGSSRK
jgi:hypothetical protein